MKVYVVRDSEAGNIITKVDTIEEGNNLIKEYEETDKKDGTYTDNFYEVAEIEEEEYLRLTGREQA